MLLKYGQGIVIRGCGRNEDFDVNLQKILDTQSPTTTIVTIGDAQFDEVIGQTTQINHNIPDNITYYGNETPDIVSVVGNTIIPLQNNKVAKILFKNGKLIKRYSFTTTLNNSTSTVYTFKNFITGSLAEHIKNNFSSLNIPEVPVPNDFRVNLNDVSTQTGITRNENNFFISKFDTSFIGYDVDSTYKHTFVAISPQHIIGARHVFGAQPNAPMTLTFYDTNGTKITRQCVRWINAYPQDLGDDIGIGFLTTPLPATVNPVKIFPSNWTTKLTKRAFDATTNLPCIVFTNNSYATGLKEFFHPYTGTAAIWNAKSNTYLNSGWRNDGASSSLVFTIVNNELVLLFSYYTRSDDSWTYLQGYNYGSYTTPIQNAMNDISNNLNNWTGFTFPTHTLQTIDLSSFVTV